MRHILIILSILLLSSPVIGQSKPLGVVLPPTVMGNVSNSRKQILLNTLDDELSQYFDVSPPTNVSGGELPVVEDVFQLQIVEEDGDTQLSVRWMSGDERKVETILCGGCKTIELNGNLKELVGKLVGGERIVQKPVVVVEKKERAVLYYRRINGEWGWYKSGDEKEDRKYIGEIKNGVPNGLGTDIFNGFKFQGEFKDGKRNGQGTFVYPTGFRELVEFNDGKRK